MAKHIRNPKIESRAARQKLKPSAKPTYFDLGGRLHLGYRKGKGAGRWVARIYVGDERYVTKTLAEADDLADANGSTVLNFGQAQDRARECMKAHDDAARIKAFGPVVTVAVAAAAYETERGATARDARGKLKHLIADAKLAATPLPALTAPDLAQWRARLLDQMGKLRRAASSTTPRRVSTPPSSATARSCRRPCATRYATASPRPAAFGLTTLGSNKSSLTPTSGAWSTRLCRSTRSRAGTATSAGRFSFLPPRARASARLRGCASATCRSVRGG